MSRHEARLASEALHLLLDIFRYHRRERRHAEAVVPS